MQTKVLVSQMEFSVSDVPVFEHCRLASNQVVRGSSPLGRTNIHTLQVDLPRDLSLSTACLVSSDFVYVRLTSAYFWAQRRKIGVKSFDSSRITHGPSPPG